MLKKCSFCKNGKSKCSVCDGFGTVDNSYNDPYYGLSTQRERCHYCKGECEVICAVCDGTGLDKVWRREKINLHKSLVRQFYDALDLSNINRTRLAVNAYESGLSEFAGDVAYIKGLYFLYAAKQNTTARRHFEASLSWIRQNKEFREFTLNYLSEAKLYKAISSAYSLDDDLINGLRYINLALDSVKKFRWELLHSYLTERAWIYYRSGASHKALQDINRVLELLANHKYIEDMLLESPFIDNARDSAKRLKKAIIDSI